MTINLKNTFIDGKFDCTLVHHTVKDKSNQANLMTLQPLAPCLAQIKGYPCLTFFPERMPCVSSAQLQEDYCPLLAYLWKKLGIQLNMAIYWTNHEPAAIVDHVVPSGRDKSLFKKKKTPDNSIP